MVREPNCTSYFMRPHLSVQSLPDRIFMHWMHLHIAQFCGVHASNTHAHSYSLLLLVGVAQMPVEGEGTLGLLPKIPFPSQTTYALCPDRRPTEAIWGSGAGHPPGPGVVSIYNVRQSHSCEGCRANALTRARLASKERINRMIRFFSHVAA